MTLAETSRGASRVNLTASANPYFYRFAIGDTKATMVSDGPMPCGSPKPHFSNSAPEDIDALLDANFVRKDNMVLEQNVLILDIGGKTVLFDTGMGTVTDFGTTCGKLMDTLATADIDPAGIDAVVLSHAHIDHVAGIMKLDGTRTFPNAQYYMDQTDFEFWTDPNQPLNLVTDTARNNLRPIRDRLVFVKDGEEFLPGVTAILAPGHSVGHLMFMVQSGKHQLCLTSDLAHQSVIQLERPLCHFGADTDAEQAAQTRLKQLTMLAEERTPMMGYHFPWPGIGHIVKSGEGFRFVPSAMENFPVA